MDSDVEKGPDAAARAPVNRRGANVFAERVVEKIIVAAIDSVPGTIAAGSAINRIAGRGYPRVDVQVDSRAQAVSVETDIAVSWPSPVRSIARTVRAVIIAWVRDTMDMQVLRCDVRVAMIEGAEDDRPSRRVDASQVADHPRHPTLKHPAPSPLRVRPLTAAPPKNPRPDGALGSRSAIVGDRGSR